MDAWMNVLLFMRVATSTTKIIRAFEPRCRHVLTLKATHGGDFEQ